MPNRSSNHSNLRRAILQYLRAKFYGRVYAVAIRGGLGTAPGTPDIVGCIDGKFFAIEVKTGSGRLSEAQVLVHDTIDKANGIIMVIRDINEVLEAFKPFERGK